MSDKQYVGSGKKKNYTNKVNDGAVIEIYLRISDIPKESIDKKGVVEVVRLVMEEKEAPDDYGNTHRIFLDRRPPKKP